MRQFTGSLRRTHGRKNTTEYAIWHGAKKRCHNPKSQAFSHYGGRGITMCDRWRDSFENFFADMGPRPRGLTLERKNNDGPYSPENCVWASRVEQGQNRRGNHRLTLDGETFTLAEWSRRRNIGYNTLKQRIYSGWTTERALTQPVRI